MKSPFSITLIVIMVGIAIGWLYFSAQRAEGATFDPTPNTNSILNAAGEALGATCNVAEAYAFLQTRILEGKTVKLVPQLTGSDGTAREGIDPELACRLQRLLQAYPSMKLRDGYRSAQEQADTCRGICGKDRCPGRCAPPNASCHQYGLAVDVTLDNATIRRVAKAQYGLHYPYKGSHIQCIEHKTAGRRSCNFPCAKGGVSISGGSYTPQPGSQQTYGSQQPTLQQLLSGLPITMPQSPSIPGAVGNGSDPLQDAIFTDPDYILGDAVGEPQLLEEVIPGNGPSAFDDLLGEFGEFGEGGDVRDVLMFEGTDRASTTPRFGNSVGTSTAFTGGQCENGGVPKRTLLGTVVCDTAGPGPELVTRVGDGETNGTQQVGILESIGFSQDTAIGSTISTLASNILPIRHVAGEDAFFDGYTSAVNSPRQTAYDAFYPRTGIARDTQVQYSLEERLVAWLLQEEPEAIERSNSIALKNVTLLIRPVVTYMIVAIFGVGGHALDAVLVLADRI